MSILNHREQELVAIGAAVASNCVPCVEHHIPEARRAGLDTSEIEAALQLADSVRRVPALGVMRAARAALASDATVDAVETPACNCAGASDEARPDGRAC